MAGKLIEVRAVRIICDVVLRERILTELERLGASGHTAWPVYGHGTVREAGWRDAFASPDRIYVEVWCRDALAERIIEYCESSKFDGIGMIAGVHPLWIHEDEAANLHDA
jgi:hypothetical protein